MGRLHITLTLLFFTAITITPTKSKDNDGSKVPLTPKIYVKLLNTRRKEHADLIRRMLEKDYSKNYKMISLALDQVFKVIEQSNKTLIDENYSPNQGFPVKERTQEAVTVIIEDTCLAADLILHFPEISQKILKNVRNWKETINWCLEFVSQFPHIIDELIVELIDLARQEINQDAATPDFVNPYYKKVETPAIPPKKPKTRKKIKKGPRLTSRSEL